MASSDLDFGILSQAACNANEQSESKDNSYIPTLEEIFESDDQSSFYAVTIKHIAKESGVKDTDLIQMYSKLQDAHKAANIDFVIEEVEEKKQTRPHLHGIMRARKNLRYTLFRKKYYHIDIQCLKTWTDLLVWQRYIHMGDIQDVNNYYTNGENHFIN